MSTKTYVVCYPDGQYTVVRSDKTIDAVGKDMVRKHGEEIEVFETGQRRAFKGWLSAVEIP